MNIDMQNGNSGTQQNEIRALDDDELCHVTGGSGPLEDFVKFLVNTVGSALHMGNGRPQL